jgi:pimeloyl-ACP methyl ester carboxylesterase
MISSLLILASLMLEINSSPFPSFSEICSSNGYQYEEHTVITDDGYILTLFRVPGSSSNPPAPNKPVVFLQHGLEDIADVWIWNTAFSPCFFLVNAGFDVWLGNSRGSVHSLGHTDWDSDSDSEYWQFTWQQMAEFDIPAMITYTLLQTKKTTLTYIGHSQGGLIMFAHLAEHPEFIDNLSLVIGLAPAISLKNTEISVLSVFELNDQSLPQNKQELAWLPRTTVITTAAIENDNQELVSDALEQGPGGTSILNYAHWAQMTLYKTYKLQKFDYGHKGNLKEYGQAFAPVYDLSKIPRPIAIFCGELDKLVTLKDIEWVEGILDEDALVYKETLKGFGHLTFIWGKPKMMEYFERVIELVKQYAS